MSASPKEKGLLQCVTTPFLHILQLKSSYPGVPRSQQNNSTIHVAYRSRNLRNCTNVADTKLWPAVQNNQGHLMGYIDAKSWHCSAFPITFVHSWPKTYEHFSLVIQDRAHHLQGRQGWSLCTYFQSDISSVSYWQVIFRLSDEILIAPLKELRFSSF